MVEKNDPRFNVIIEVKTEEEAEEVLEAFEGAGAFVIGRPVADQKCEMCGEEDELRPYGPGGKNVCFDCGMLDEEEMTRQFERQFP